MYTYGLLNRYGNDKNNNLVNKKKLARRGVRVKTGSDRLQRE